MRSAFGAGRAGNCGSVWDAVLSGCIQLEKAEPFGNCTASVRVGGASGIAVLTLTNGASSQLVERTGVASARDACNCDCGLYTTTRISGPLDVTGSSVSSMTTSSANKLLCRICCSCGLEWTRRRLICSVLLGMGRPTFPRCVGESGGRWLAFGGSVFSEPASVAAIAEESGDDNADV